MKKASNHKGRTDKKKNLEKMSKKRKRSKKRKKIEAGTEIIDLKYEIESAKLILDMIGRDGGGIKFTRFDGIMNKHKK